MEIENTNIELFNNNRARLNDYKLAYRLQKKNDAIETELQKRFDFINVDVPISKKQIAKNYYILNKKHILACKKITDAEKKPSNKLYADKYYKLNRVKILAKSRIYYQINKEAILEYHKIYVLNNQEKLHDYRTEYYDKNNK